MSIDLLGAAELLADDGLLLADLRDRWYREQQDEAEKAIVALVAAWLLTLEREATPDAVLRYAVWLRAEEALAAKLEPVLYRIAWQAARRQALELGEAFPLWARRRLRQWAAQEAASQARRIVEETSRAVVDAYQIGIQAGLGHEEAVRLALSARAHTLNRRFAQAVVRRALKEEPGARHGVAARYGQRLDRVRRVTVARTLSAAAVSEGVRAAGDSLLTMGARLYKQWLTALDERVCPGCRPMHGRVIPYDGLFVTPFGVVWSSPLHPRCRCQTRLLRAEEVERATVPG